MVMYLSRYENCVPSYCAAELCTFVISAASCCDNNSKDHDEIKLKCNCTLVRSVGF